MTREIDQKVVQMELPAKAAQICAEMRAYWEALRMGRQVPARSDIDPRGIERALEYAFIIERVAPGMGRFRLAGMHLNDLMGMEVRGMPLTAMFAPKGRKKVAEATEAAFQNPAIVELDLVAETGIGKPPLKGKLLILPLKSDLGDISRALGCFVAEGASMGRTPRRFEVAAARIMPIETGKPTQTKEPVRPAQLGFAEDAPTFAAPPRRPAAPIAPTQDTPEERRAMFRIVTND
ncbi:PAS domain-containing protein [Thioclava sp. SK-1]|uniref:PAS domain-containing protein n=1 Tax=Thioclava sp. SK-1 TaxID=1889770 RepID=UPI000826E55F|nr:PAS domain-containing protein [Thioclava sp. SK-1]OCX62278.1 PAS domain-containing protein [Thioclava sp. SK-1]